MCADAEERSPKFNQQAFPPFNEYEPDNVVINPMGDLEAGKYVLINHLFH